MLKILRRNSVGKECEWWHAQEPHARARAHNRCSVHHFPIWVLLICSELYWLLSFSQIKAKWFYLMSHLLFLTWQTCTICFMNLGLLCVLSVPLLLHSNLSLQNLSMTIFSGESFCSLAQKTQKTIVPQSEAGPDPRSDALSALMTHHL